MAKVKCVSVRQPWAWLLVNGLKDVENRTWPTNHRGRLLIHAAQRSDDTPELRAALLADHNIRLPAVLPTGGIVGEVTVVDCVTEHRSPWFSGPFGWLLMNGRARKFRPMAGRLGLFSVDV